MGPTTRLIHGAAEAVLPTLDAGSVQTCVTSPPYFGLRDYKVAGQIGLENRPEDYVARLAVVFREVYRVLRDDGTLWLNLGDSYTSGGRKWRAPDRKNVSRAMATRAPTPSGLREKELIGIPWMVAFALRAGGWIIRQDIVWNKPNVQPESVRDRCTKAHEYIFLLVKDPAYYYDRHAIMEPAANGRMRNKRSVWTVPTRSHKGVHFAVFPPDLIEPAVRAATSEAGECPDCGHVWTRTVKKVATGRVRQRATGGLGNKHRRETHGLKPVGGQFREGVEYHTTGWAGCKCATPIPQTVLDPFMGSGVTGMVSRKLGRSFIGIDLNADYLALAQQRIDSGV